LEGTPSQRAQEKKKQAESSTGEPVTRLIPKSSDSGGSISRKAKATNQNTIEKLIQSTRKATGKEAERK